MKKQQLGSYPGKKLLRNEMKNLSGGSAAAGTWACPADGYTCYSTKTKCIAACSNKVCQFFSACP